MQTDSHSVINDMVARGVFRAKALPGKVAQDCAWQITWFGGHVMCLEVTGEQVQIAPVLPDLPARSQLYRDLRAWLRIQQSEALPEHRRLDPEDVRLEVRNRNGQIRLTLQSLKEPMPDLLARAVQLINALYLEFLNGPGRLDWVTEAFGLDPDNPRLA